MSNSQRAAALKSATSKQIAQAAYDTAIWYQTAALQLLRFCNAEKAEQEERKDPFKLPWQEDNLCPFVAEKVFLLIAVNHVLDGVSALNEMLIGRNDNKLDIIAKEFLCEDDFCQKMKHLRNANEHKLDYSLGNGRQQEKFDSTIDTDRGSVNTNSHWYSHIGSNGYIGGVNIKDIADHIGSYKEKIIKILHSIHIEYLQKGMEQWTK